jgi:hypothetical protein
LKALQFLDGRGLLSSQIEAGDIKAKRYAEMRRAYKEVLLDRLRTIASWILHFTSRLSSGDLQIHESGFLASAVFSRELEPRQCRKSSSQREDWLPQEDRIIQKDRRHPESKPRDQKWYTALTIWYILKQYPATFQDHVLNRLLWNSLPYFNSIRNEDNQSGTTALDDSYTCFLRWHYSYPVTQIYRELHIDDPFLFLSYKIDISKHQNLSKLWQIKAENRLDYLGWSD